MNDKTKRGDIDKLIEKLGTRSDPKKLIEKLDVMIEYDVQSCHNGKETLKEIKGVLENYERMMKLVRVIEEPLNPIASGDLLEGIWRVVQGCDTYDVRNKERIRKLLQSRQPEKVRFTWEEISHITDSIAFPNDDGKAFSYLISVFKSKGIEVVEK